MKARNFTAQQVADYVLNTYKDAFRYSTLEIERISFLSETTPPTWSVQFVLKSTIPGISDHTLFTMVSQRRNPYGNKEYYLLVTGSIELDLTVKAKTIKEETEAAQKKARELYTPKQELQA